MAISPRTQHILRLIMGDVTAANELLNDIALNSAVRSVQGFTGAIKLTTDNIPQGVTNKYFSNALARSAINAIGPIGYNPITGQISLKDFPNGSQIYTGNGAPDPSLGQAGDFYVDNVSLNYYSNINGTWTIQGNFFGGGSTLTGLIGDIVATGPGSATATIQPNVVTNAKLAQAPAFTIKGNSTASTANEADLTGAQVNSFLPIFTALLNGLVPFSGGGTTNFLRADGTWAPPPGGGGGTLAGDVTGPIGSNTIAASVVTSKLLTGFVIGADSTVLATDSILTAFGKLQSQIDNSSVSAITQLTGDGTAVGPGNVVFTLATVNTNVGSFGSASNSAIFTVNGKGLITAASSAPIQIAESQVTSLLTDLASINSNLVTAFIDISGKQAAGSYELTSNKGIANGYAPLDGSAKIPLSYLPLTVMEYQGAWNPSTNTPALSDGTGTNGYVYYVSATFVGPVAGLTDPSMHNFQIGDLIIYSASVGKWQLASPVAGVSSVNNAQGAVTVNAINQLTGDVTTALASGSQSEVATVVAIQGVGVTAVAPTDGQTIVYNAIAGKYLLQAFGAVDANVLLGTTLASNVINSSLQNLGIQSANLNMGNNAIVNVSQIGIGTLTPSSPIDIVDTSGSTQAIQATGYSSSVGFRGRYANGTLLSPTAAISGNTLGFISGRGYGATAFAAASTASISFIADGTFTDTSMPTYISFKTTPVGSVTAVEAFRIDSNGSVDLGGTTGFTYAYYLGILSNAEGPVLITANNPGTIGLSVTLVFDGSSNISTIISNWNTANPSNQISLTIGDGTQVPNNGVTIMLGGPAALNVIAKAVASNANASGTPGINAAQFTGGTGGNTTIASTGTGGAGGGYSFTGGNGGIASAAVNAKGGTGGGYLVTPGNGGNAVEAGALLNTGGNGGSTIIQSGNGGNAANGTTNNSGSGGAISLLAGSGGQGTNGAIGGIITLTSGAGGIPNGVGAGGAGGTLNLNGGTGGVGSTTSANGGAVNITGGPGGSTNPNGSGGAVNISGGTPSQNTSGGTGGAVTITGANSAGDNTVSRNGGAVTIVAGNSSGNSAGAAITATAGVGGAGTGTAGVAGGNIVLTGGTGGIGSATSGGGGLLTFNGGVGGAGVAGGAGGAVNINGGVGGSGSSSSGAGGLVTIAGGAAGAGGSGNAAGGVTIRGGVADPVTGAGSGGPGGTVTITGSAATGDQTANYAGGNVTITAGLSFGSSAGGAITGTAGAGGQGLALTGAAGGGVTWTTGAGGIGTNVGGAGGTLGLVGGAGGIGTGTVGGAGGAFVWTAGIGGAGGTTSGNGGGITITSGAPGGGVNGGGSAGAISITGGTANANGSGGGSVTITGSSAAGTDAVSFPGGSVTLNAGKSQGASVGGAIGGTAGIGGAGLAGAGANGGAVTWTAGAGGIGSSTSGNGGAMTLTAGAGGAGVVGGAGGTAALTGGAGGAGSTSGGNGGAVTVAGGVAAAVNGSAGGAATLKGGNSPAAGGPGGGVTITGTAATAGTGGNFAGGAVTITAGASAGQTVGAAITGVAGVGGAGSAGVGQNGGAVTWTSGAGGVGTTSNGNGGLVSLIGGSGGAAGGPLGGTGGGISLLAGAGGQGTTTNGNGGNIQISAGIAGAGAGTAGVGGAISFSTSATSAAVVLRMTITNAGLVGIGNNASPTYLLDVLGGDIGLATLGKKIRIKEGANGSQGTATLGAGGTVVVATTAFTATSRVYFSILSANGGTPGFLWISASTAGTSFTILSSNAADRSIVSWLIHEPY